MDLHQIEEKLAKEEISLELYAILSKRIARDKSCLVECENLLESTLPSGNKKLIAELLNEKATYIYQFESNYTKSLDIAFQAYHLCDNSEEFKLTKINCASTIGVVSSFIGELNQARNYFSEAISLLETIENPNHYIKRLLGNNYFNLTNLYIETKSNETRLGYLDKAKSYFLAINYKLGYARCLNSYSIIHPAYKDSELGLQNYIEAEKIFLELNDNRGRGVILCNLGVYYCNHDEFEKGIDCLNTSIELLESVGQKKFVQNAYLMRGISYSNNEDLDKAIADFKVCEQLLKETGSRKDEMALFQEWSHVLQKKGEFEEALYMLHNYLIVKDELDQFDKKSALSEEKIAFELQEKEREAEFLRKKNEEIQAYTHQLEISNIDLKRFAHIASHDMREPLRMVNLYVQKLERSMENTADTNQKDYFNYIKLGAHRMYSLIDSILNLNNIHPIIKKESINLNEVLDDIRIQLKVLLKERNVAIEYDQLPIINAERNLMFQVFQNIISNAIKYNKNDVIKINIHSHTSEKFHAIRIADNGIGIHPQYREKVFEIFQRLNHKDEYEGTGIGLTIVKKIMDTLLGKIEIEENHPQGTIFILHFPV